MRCVPSRRYFSVLAGLTLTFARVGSAAPQRSAGIAALQLQDTGLVVAAAESITAAVVARWREVLDQDTLQRRFTPSEGLERTARFVAAEFERLDLRPAGEDSTWFLRYPIPGDLRLDNTNSLVVFEVLMSLDGQSIRTESGDWRWRKVELSLATDARLETTSVLADPTGRHVRRSAALIAGPQTQASVARVNLHGKIAIYVPPAASERAVDGAVRDAVLAQLQQSAAGVIVLVREDSATFASGIKTSVRVLDDYVSLAASAPVAPAPVIAVRAQALAPVLAAVGSDLSTVSDARTPIIRALQGLSVSFQPSVDSAARDRATAPNVLGILAGRDSVLKHEFIVVSTHMDHGTARPRPEGDASVSVRGDPSTADVTGLLALVRAFTQAGVQPRRSLLFFVSSGTEGLWGSSHFAKKGYTIAGGRMVFNVTLDFFGTSGDSLSVNGLHEVELQPTPVWVASAHPELGVKVGDGGSVFDGMSDHLPFVRKRLPALYLHSGTPPDTANRSAPAAAGVIPIEDEARILRLAFYVIRQAAEADQRPRWSAEGLRQLAVDRQP